MHNNRGNCYFVQKKCYFIRKNEMYRSIHYKLHNIYMKLSIYRKIINISMSFSIK